MNHKSLSFQTPRLVLFIAGGVLFLILFGSGFKGTTPAVGRGGDPTNTPDYQFLALLRRDLTPTPSPTPTVQPTPTQSPLPQIVTTMDLPAALCPSDSSSNPVSGHTYIANRDSGNVTVFDGLNLLGYAATGEWPTLVRHQLDTDRTYVTNLHGPVSVFEDGVFVKNLAAAPEPGGPQYGEPYVVTHNPVNDYLYVNYIGGSVVQLMANDTHMSNVFLAAGWILENITDPVTGLTYVFSWETGQVFVFDDAAIVETFQMGWGMAEAILDSERGIFYVAHSSPNANYPHNISVFERGDHTVTQIETSTESRGMALDPVTGYVYITNPKLDTVSIVSGRNLLGNVPVGDEPWDVAVHPTSGYAFVTNQKGDSVTILRNGVLLSTVPVGNHPMTVTADPVNNYVYVVNQNSEIECNDVQQCQRVCYTPSVTIFR